MSDAETFLRIAAARASRRHPVLLKILDDGRIHLSGLAVLAPHLTDSNCDELLARATHKTKSEIQVLVAEIAPKPDVVASIRKLPGRREKKRPEAPERESTDSPGERATSSVESTPSGKSNPPSETGPARVEGEKRPVVEPLAPSRYRVQFTASAEFHDKIVKRFVWERDQGQCTFESPEGRRCPERRGLEFHHDNPYGFGGDRSAQNVRLMCRAHNLYMAELDFGKEEMDQYRRRADRVREPSPAFSLFPDGARETYETAAGLQKLRHLTRPVMNVL